MESLVIPIFPLQWDIVAFSPISPMASRDIHQAPPSIGNALSSADKARPTLQKEQFSHNVGQYWELVKKLQAKKEQSALYA